MDEYIGLTADHEQSHRETSRREFTRHINIPDARVHGPDGSAADLRAAAEEYEQLLTATGGVVIQILGVGTVGHIGFNEPGSSVVSRTRVKILHPQTDQDNARFFNSPQDVPVHVLTQGLGAIHEAGHLVLLATGKAKAGVVTALASCRSSVGARRLLQGGLGQEACSAAALKS